MTPSLPFAQDEYIGVSDSHVVEPEAITRLSTQNERILARLKRGPCANTDLLKIAVRYGARIGDLRKAGHVITCTQDKASGVSVYRLEE